MLRNISRLALSVIGAAFLAAVGWATKAALDASASHGGVGRILGAVLSIPGNLLEHGAIFCVSLTSGLLIGFLISSGARAIDVRSKSAEAWRMGMLRRETRFAAYLCSHRWLRILTQDLWEDLRKLSAQFVLRGLPPIPAVEMDDARGLRDVTGYLRVVGPHLVEGGLPFAVICAHAFAERHPAFVGRSTPHPGVTAQPTEIVPTKPKTKKRPRSAGPDTEKADEAGRPSAHVRVRPSPVIAYASQKGSLSSPGSRSRSNSNDPRKAPTAHLPSAPDAGQERLPEPSRTS